MNEEAAEQERRAAHQASMEAMARRATEASLRLARYGIPFPVQVTPDGSGGVQVQTLLTGWVTTALAELLLREVEAGRLDPFPGVPSPSEAARRAADELAARRERGAGPDRDGAYVQRDEGGKVKSVLLPMKDEGDPN